jgi:hypothetical protein
MRRVVLALIHLGVIAACIACILVFSRRRSVECAWDHMRASCVVESEDSLGRIEHDRIDGVRGAAYRSGPVVGLVTDAQHHGEHALFGTHEVELANDADAQRLAAFAINHDPDQVSIRSGVPHPRVITGVVLFGVLVYGILTRRRRKS